MLFSNALNSQVSLNNPSFEDEPADATTPQGWFPCDNMTTPDIFPGFWGVYNEAADGETYVGIITRENSTFERFGQRLSMDLVKGQCYFTAIDLSYSKVYSGYNKPIQLKIVFSIDKCSNDEVVFLSPVIQHTDWKTYKVEFTPNANYRYIKLEAYYSDEKFSHKGNILIDNIRPIRRCGNA
ncbi:MAG: hypothetical protein V3V14_14095 [Saprospiraceae bacterium]